MPPDLTKLTVILNPQTTTTSQHGENHIYEVLNYKPLGKSLFLLGGVLFVALPCIYAFLWLETRVCLYLSGALTTVQPDHELLTPEPLGSAASGLSASARDGEGPKASPTTLSPTSIKLAEAEMGGMGIPEHSGASMHHRPHMHAHAGSVKASCA